MREKFIMLVFFMFMSISLVSAYSLPVSDNYIKLGDYLLLLKMPKQRLYLTNDGKNIDNKASTYNAPIIADDLSFYGYQVSIKGYSQPLFVKFVFSSDGKLRDWLSEITQELNSKRIKIGDLPKIGKFYKYEYQATTFYIGSSAPFVGRDGRPLLFTLSLDRGKPYSCDFVFNWQKNIQVFASAGHHEISLEMCGKAFLPILSAIDKTQQKTD